MGANLVRQLCRFHRCSPDRGWQFSLDQVIQFLKSRVAKGEPAWKRLKAVEALIRFQKNLPDEKRTDLTFVRVKLQEHVAFKKTQSNASGYRGNIGSEANRDESRRDESRRDESSENELLRERTLEIEPTPEDMVGKINPREPELIQELRRKLRLGGRAWNTEIAFVKWVRLAYRKPTVPI